MRLSTTAATNRLLTTLAMATLWLTGSAGGLAAEAPETNKSSAPADNTVVLSHATLWRFFRVRDAVHVRHTNGVLARAALSCSGHEWQPGGWEASGTSPVPPADWAGTGGKTDRRQSGCRQVSGPRGTARPAAT